MNYETNFKQRVAIYLNKKYTRTEKRTDQKSKMIGFVHNQSIIFILLGVFFLQKVVVFCLNLNTYFNKFQ